MSYIIKKVEFNKEVYSVVEDYSKIKKEIGEGLVSEHTSIKAVLDVSMSSRIKELVPKYENKNMALVPSEEYSSVHNEDLVGDIYTFYSKDDCYNKVLYVVTSLKELKKMVGIYLGSNKEVEDIYAISFEKKKYKCLNVTIDGFELEIK